MCRLYEPDASCARKLVVMFESARQIFEAGGWVMYPLALLSMTSLTLVLERAVFFLSSGGRSSVADHLAASMSSPDRARSAAAAGRSVYHRYALAMVELASETPDREARSLRALARIQPDIERFMGVLATIIAAAPLLGILGTVTGIIDSFGLIGSAESITDPAQLAEGISEALYTTAFGLSIALATVFPYAVLRARLQRVLSSLEVIAASAPDGKTD